MFKPSIPDDRFMFELASFLRSQPRDTIAIQVKRVVTAARIKVVKCVINGEQLCDISVNALGGVGSLAFMEAADTHIGRDHMFKKSVIFIKAWLTYENEYKILGSSKNLLSTYALQVMILFIINKFYVQIHSPVECLRLFLSYFSSFDWSKHMLTVNGVLPVGLNTSSVEYEAVDHPILDHQFVQACREKLRVVESINGSFEEKEINIIDPLDLNNNLGTSVKNKEDFIKGIYEGHRKIEIVRQFPVLSEVFARSEGQLLDLEGGDWSETVKEARRCYKMIDSDRDPKKKCETVKVERRSSVKGKRNKCASGRECVPKVSSSSVFKFATANPPEVLRIDPCALASLASGPKPSYPFKILLTVPHLLTPEEVRASILVLHNHLLVRGGSLATSEQVSGILDKEVQTLITFELELDHQEEADFYKKIWPDVITRAICALSDHAASLLSQIADVCAAMSCEALKTDPTSAFNPFTDSGDGLSDKDRASVASDMKLLLYGSKMISVNTHCIDAIYDIPRTHGRLRSLCKSINCSTGAELNSVLLLHGGASKDLCGVFSSLVFALESVGEGSWQRANGCLDQLVKKANLFPHLAQRFSEGCPNVDKLKLLTKAFLTYKEEQHYIDSLHSVYSLSEAVRKILSWEATLSFISLEGTELITVKEVVADVEKKKDKKKKALGKGTTVLMQLVKDRLQSVLTRNMDDAESLPQIVSSAFLSLLDPKDARLDKLLEKLKQIVSSNGGTRLPLGTRDLSKEQMVVRERAFSIVSNVLKRHGAMQLDTPVLELTETLAGKYGEASKFIYELADQGDEPCSLRYDLTVPFARHVAMSGITSSRCYQIAKVYRRDKPCKGRYREFYQCNFDIAGDASMGADFELVHVLTELLDQLNMGEYEIKLNHRKLVDGMLEICGVPSHKFRTVCSSIDKLGGQKLEQIKRELIGEKGLDIETVDKICSYVNLRGQPVEILLQLKKEGGPFLTNDSSNQALKDLDKLVQALDSARCVEKVVLDLGLAGGLDYYTGLIYEATLKGDKEGGAIARGGRYDDLIGRFGTQPVAAIGVSLEIERVLTYMEQNNKDEEEQIVGARETQVLVSIFGDDFSLAANLVSKCWRANLRAQFLVHKRQSKHFDRAKACGIPWIVMVGDRERRKGMVTLKYKDAEFEKEVRGCEFVEELLELINNPPILGK